MDQGPSQWRHLHSDGRGGEREIIDSRQEINLSPYHVGYYVLRRYFATKAGQGNPNKYGSWWRGPNLITAATQVPIVYGFTKTWYTMTKPGDKVGILCGHHALEAFLLRPGFCNTIEHRCGTPREVRKILEHDFSDPKNKLWLVKWLWLVDRRPTNLQEVRGKKVDA